VNREETRIEESMFPLVLSRHVSRGPKDDLWRASSSGVIGRHVVSQECVNYVQTGATQGETRKVSAGEEWNEGCKGNERGHTNKGCLHFSLSVSSIHSK